MNYTLDELNDFIEAKKIDTKLDDTCFRTILLDPDEGLLESLELSMYVKPPIIIFVFLLLTRFFSHFHFFIEIASKSMSFPLAINHGYTDV